MMKECGLDWTQVHKDPQKLARLAETIWVNHGVECIKLPFDMAVESEILGSAIEWGTYDTLPTEYMGAFDHPDKLVIPEDFLDRGRVPLVLDTIEILRKRYDNEVAIVSSIVGPFTLASKVFGFETFFLWLVEHPDMAHKALDLLTDIAIKYAAAQVNAGADAILIGEASCSGSLISGSTYATYGVPYQTRLCATLKQVPTIMHICGKTDKHLPHLLTTGVTAYSFDENANMNTLQETLKGKVSLIGYIPTVEVMLRGTPGMVYESATNCLQSGVDVLAVGCSMPPHTTSANIAAMVKAAHDWHQPVPA
jgi:MtaA/CmuA family methyltransferase